MQNKNLRGPKTSKQVVEKILLLKKSDSEGKLTAKEIRNILLKSHKEAYIPKERAINNILKKNSDKIEYNHVDDMWSIASLADYPIPTDLVPEIMRMMEHMQDKQYETEEFYSIRQALWAARLYGSVHELFESNIETMTDDDFYFILGEIAFLYSSSERLGEISKNKYINSYELDNDIFINTEYFKMTQMERMSYLARQISRISNTTTSRKVNK